MSKVTVEQSPWAFAMKVAVAVAVVIAAVCVIAFTLHLARMADEKLRLSINEFGEIPAIEEIQLKERVLAFPGALGYGKNAKGGRGGRVLVVNTVKDVVNASDEFLSLREAIQVETGPRTVVFSVGGVFDTGNQRLAISGEGGSYLTVACQSAPNPGVIIKTFGFVVSQNAHDLVLRHCAVRGTDVGYPGAKAGRGMTIQGGSRNIILDHMSLSWATDEGFQVYIDGKQTQGTSNVTLSNSIIAEGDADSSHNLSAQYPNWGYHSMGPSCINNNANFKPEKCSIVNNYIAHNSSRNGIIWGGTGEVSNNIVYNWHSIGVGAQTYYTGVDAHLNNNLMKAGPQTTTGGTSNSRCGPNEYKCALALGFPMNGLATNYQAENNYYIDNNRSVGDAVLIVNDRQTAGTAPSVQLATPSPTDVRAMAAKGSRHMNCVGASKPSRDAVDKRVISEFYNGTGAIGIGDNIRNGGHNVTKQRTFEIYGGPTTHQAGHDKDQDGMPDAWEVSYGLSDSNPNDHSGDKDGDGYTNLEEYLAIAATCR